VYVILVKLVLFAYARHVSHVSSKRCWVRVKLIGGRPTNKPPASKRFCRNSLLSCDRLYIDVKAVNVSAWVLIFNAWLTAKIVSCRNAIQRHYRTLIETHLHHAASRHICFTDRPGVTEWGWRGVIIHQLTCGMRHLMFENNWGKMRSNEATMQT